MIRKGAYALFMAFGKDISVKVGSLGTLYLECGEYCYIGSAKNGLDQRIKRHLSSEKRIHWHIDNLTVLADSMEAYETTSLEECALRSAAGDAGMVPAVKGFGCSDCRCDTHLMRSGTSSKARLLGECGFERFIG